MYAMWFLLVSLILATGKDKKIIKENACIVMKKSLVFYIGSDPKDEKANWVMHEYILEGNK